MLLTLGLFSMWLKYSETCWHLSDELHFQLILGASLCVELWNMSLER